MPIRRIAGLTALALLVAGCTNGYAAHTAATERSGITFSTPFSQGSR
jgi:hypothetical protein